MEQASTAPLSTHSSLAVDGSRRGTWKRPGDWKETSRSLSKPCAFCGKEFSPRRWTNVHGKEVIVRKAVWDKQTCCGQSCAKKLKNPMSKNQARLRMRETLRRIRHRPIRRGGNGRLLPLPQLALLHALGEGWESEVPVTTGVGRQPGGYPTCYKIDIANRERMIAIEIDGGSHVSIERRSQDAKKAAFLASCGWSVFRVSNQRALELYSTYTSTDTLLSSLMESSSTTAISCPNVARACT